MSGFEVRMIINGSGSLRVIELDYSCDATLDCAGGEQMALVILLLDSASSSSRADSSGLTALPLLRFEEWH